jgi:hypothetical protein
MILYVCSLVKVLEGVGNRYLPGCERSEEVVSAHWEPS